MWVPWNVLPFNTVRPDPKTTPALARSYLFDTRDAVNHWGIPRARYDDIATLDLLVKRPLGIQHFAAPGLNASNVVVDLAARMAAQSGKVGK